jgi:hypothetical protein
MWEPSAPGAPVMKLIGVIDAARPAPRARGACPMLDYRRG